jgi:hypothetical protein
VSGTKPRQILWTAAAGLLAPALGITAFEGASGYFAVFVGAPNV